ncbi:MAG: enoyl-CoA hydratase-related protein [Candidatus Kapabacteria bacterium]|nr:enoyl-CoA hydratase-related protein [Candidatus Kapabacteria bacterium]MDW8012544.1 enoyl-CoA hydratase-related protein [Bacteroidota bacterium]
MSLVEVLPAEGYRRLRLNRPEKRNALSPELLRELSLQLHQAQEDPSVRVIVIEGAGPAFCAGADLAYLHQLTQYTPMENLADSELLMRVLWQLYTYPKPTIAKVHGPAIAGGCGLASACDIIVAARNGARFGYSEVRLGFVPALVGVLLVHKIGEQRSRRLLLTAELISAEEAERLGLVSYVVEDEQLDAFVEELAQRLASYSAASLQLTKAMLSAVQSMPPESALHYAAGLNVLARTTPEFRAGIESFLQQRGSSHNA